MSNKTFKEQIKKIATTPSLKSKQLGSLQQLLDTPKSKPKKFIHTWFGGFSFGALASLIMAIIIYTSLGTSDLAQQIANEVTTNHIKLKSMEVKSKKFDTVKKHFNSLDFLPIKSTRFESKGMTLMGGRYCSIKSALAAQLRYQDSSGSLHTLYQTSYEDDLFAGIPTLQDKNSKIFRYAKGLTVNIWLEDGLFMASVSEKTENIN